MRTQTFCDWLQREIESSRMALVKLYESRDRLLYVDAQALRRKYMDLIGHGEESVLQAELEVSMLRKKIELIQRAINRREPIDLSEIEAQIEAERQQEVSRLESADLTLEELPQLTEQQERTLQRQYREITSSFHPAMNADITDAQRELYEKAVDAYKRQNLDEMKIIYDSLFAPVDLSGISFGIGSAAQTTPEERRAEYHGIANVLSTDYLLAKQLYDCFIPLEEDGVVLAKLREYEAQRRDVENEIAAIRAGFPFNAVDTMNDPAKTRAYLAELAVRAKRCELEKDDLEKRIAALTEEHGNA